MDDNLSCSFDESEKLMVHLRDGCLPSVLKPFRQVITHHRWPSKRWRLSGRGLNESKRTKPKLRQTIRLGCRATILFFLRDEFCKLTWILNCLAKCISMTFLNRVEFIQICHLGRLFGSQPFVRWETIEVDFEMIGYKVKIMPCLKWTFTEFTFC